MEQFYLGIDVAKAKLDCALLLSPLAIIRPERFRHIPTAGELFIQVSAKGAYSPFVLKNRQKGNVLAYGWGYVSCLTKPFVLTYRHVVPSSP